MVVQISLGHMDKDWSLVSFNTGHKCHQITHLQHKYQHKGNLFTACQDIVINMDEGTQSKRISTPIMNFYFFLSDLQFETTQGMKVKVCFEISIIESVL